MSRFTLPALVLLATPLLLAPTVQTRTKDRKPADFPTLMSNASKQWNEKQMGSCIATLNEALGLATKARVAVIRGALPNAPAGWDQVPEKDQNNAQAAAAMAALGGIAGSIIDRRWKQTEGRGSINVTVTADSPMVGMMSGYLTNPALLGENKELIEYGTHKAILETGKKSRLSMQIMIDGKHLVDVKTTELTEDELFKMWSQASVDRLASALSN